MANTLNRSAPATEGISPGAARALVRFAAQLQKSQRFRDLSGAIQEHWTIC
jgi:hypothetical protein